MSLFVFFCFSSQSSKQVESKQIARMKERIKKLTAAIESAKRGEPIDYSLLNEAEEEGQQQQQQQQQQQLQQEQEGSRQNEDEANYEEPEDISF